MPQGLIPRLTWTVVLTGALLIAIFVGLVLRFSGGLREEVHRKMIERAAAVLHPVVSQQIENEVTAVAATPDPKRLFSALFRDARQEGLLATAAFDADGSTVASVPAAQLFVELPGDDYFNLQNSGPISRYHPEFSLDELFPAVAAGERRSPVLEVLLPLRRRGDPATLGFVRYYFDARALAGELAAIDARISRQTQATLMIGVVLIAVVVAGAFAGLRRAERALAERNARLTRANFELTLAVKASALGQITSHLIHGLQGPVAGLRAAVAGQTSPDWRTAAGYAERLQTLIAETVGLLEDTRAPAGDELTSVELVRTIERGGSPGAAAKGVRLAVRTLAAAAIDSHRGSLLCLIAANLVHNAIEATPRGRRVDVVLTQADGRLTLQVADEGEGIPEPVRARLFQPGCTSKEGGSGLGLAISRLLALQIGAELDLKATGAAGTTFELSLAV